MSLHWTNLDSTKAGIKILQWKKYHGIVSLAKVLNEERIATYQVNGASGWIYNYAAKLVDDDVIQILKDLADQQQLVFKYESILAGEFINTGENRMVLHHLTRGQLGPDIVFQGRNLSHFYQEQLNNIFEFSKKIHAEGRFEHVVQIGIGGSDLGPRAIYLALENYVKAKKGKLKLKAHFISNVDPDDAYGVLSELPLEKTLFILVSKSGVTQETLANEKLVSVYLEEKGLKPSQHMIAVTSETSPLAKNPNYLASFYIDDFIGGRYSSTSAVGVTILTLAFGEEVVKEFLLGAHEADRNALEKDILKNAALCDALIGVFERNGLNFPYTAILPYSQALNRFPAHLQQLDMESNGKSVNRFGEPIAYSTGPVIFGEPGTNGQHSFYQLLHQGTDIVPLQFIGFIKAQQDKDVEVHGTNSQTKLKANLVAQIVAFAQGKSNPNPNKNFEGFRPSSLLLAEQLTPRTLGALLAHFENKVMFQGFTWNINSFDQEGVQLGKVLTNDVLSGKSDNHALNAYAALLKI
jgi:glucose-6-phosphate isomerase